MFSILELLLGAFSNEKIILVYVCVCSVYVCLDMCLHVGCVYAMACIRARVPSLSTLSRVYFVWPCTVYSRLTGLHTSGGVSSFLSCHRSEGITDKPPCSTTWFCVDMGHQACGTTDFTCWTIFFPKNTSLLRPFLLHGSSSCCESSVSLDSFVLPIFWVLLHALEFCSCLPIFSLYRGCCVL